MKKRKLTRAVAGRPMQLGAGDWNTVCDVVEQCLEADSQGSGPTHSSISASDQVVIRNNMSTTVPCFGVFSVETAMFPYRMHDEQVRYALNAGIEVTGTMPRGKKEEILCIPQQTVGSRKLCHGIVFGPTCVRVDVQKLKHSHARAIRGDTEKLESSDTGPVRLMVPNVRLGVQICYGILGLEQGEPSIDAKEKFPAVVYKTSHEEKQKDGSVKDIPDTYIVCPGGRGEEQSIKTVHVLHVESRRMSTELFGSLPVAMNNFDAVLADNGYGEPLLVCSPGDVDEGIRYPVQRYDFVQEEWAKTDTNQSLAGCPAFLKDNKMIVAGGQSAYFVSNPVKLGISGTTQFYGHHVTPYWNIDPISGALETRVPRRQITSGTTEQVECHVVNHEKRFMKQNFCGIPFSRSENGLSVEFLAVGGTELLGYQSKAVVTYTVDSIGTYVDCENNENRILNKCELFPDTPYPLGECRAVRIKKFLSGNLTMDGDWLVCIGGRYRDEEGKFVLHEKPWSLNLDDKTEGWRNDFFPELKTPRYNAALSEVVTTDEEVPVTHTVTHPDGTTTEEPVIDPDTGEPQTETKTYDRVFLIGGRNDKGLLTSIEALNLTKGEWETDWPGLDGYVPPKEEQ